MREIKFRAWDSKSKEMVYSEKEDCFYINTKGVMFMYANPNPEGGVVTYHKSYDVEQFTGEKDKKFVDVYKGDILKMYRQDPYGYGHIESTVSKFEFTGPNSATRIGEMPDIRVVVWHKGALMLQCRDGGHGHMKPFSSLANPGESFEIIGNTTQSPELLENK